MALRGTAGSLVLKRRLPSARAGRTRALCDSKTIHSDQQPLSHNRSDCTFLIFQQVSAAFTCTRARAHTSSRLPAPLCSHPRPPAKRTNAETIVLHVVVLCCVEDRVAAPWRSRPQPPPQRATRSTMGRSATDDIWCRSSLTVSHARLTLKRRALLAAAVRAASHSVRLECDMAVDFTQLKRMTGFSTAGKSEAL
jgi:hypothetical protein